MGTQFVFTSSTQTSNQSSVAENHYHRNKHKQAKKNCNPPIFIGDKYINQSNSINMVSSSKVIAAAMLGSALCLSGASVVKAEPSGGSVIAATITKAAGSISNEIATSEAGKLRLAFEEAEQLRQNLKEALAVSAHDHGHDHGHGHDLDHHHHDHEHHHHDADDTPSSHGSGCRCAGCCEEKDTSATRKLMEKKEKLEADNFPNAVAANQAKTQFNGYTPEETERWLQEDCPDLPWETYAVSPKVRTVYKEGDSTQCDDLSDFDKEMIVRTLKLASHNVWQAKRGEKPDGGLFGAVVAKDGKILGQAWNTVLLEQDPSRHGEMNAMRQATHAAGEKYDLDYLEGATLYTSNAPCPMCYAAAAWARYDRIIYAGDYADADTFGGFVDGQIREALAIPEISKRDKLAVGGCQYDGDLAHSLWEAYNETVYHDGKGATY